MKRKGWTKGFILGFVSTFLMFPLILIFNRKKLNKENKDEKK